MGRGALIGIRQAVDRTHVCKESLGLLRDEELVLVSLGELAARQLIAHRLVVEA